MPPLHLPPQTRYTEPTLSAIQSLVPLFGLAGLQASVARADPVTGAKRKLRKSYKGHIADLPGKNEIPTDHFLLRLVHAPEPDPPIDVGRPVDPELLDTVFSMDKTPDAGVAGFDASVLGLVAASPPAAAAAGMTTTTTRKDKAGSAGAAESSAGEEKRRRRKRKSAGLTGGEGSDDVGLSTDGGGGRRRKRRNVS